MSFPICVDPWNFEAASGPGASGARGVKSDYPIAVGTWRSLVAHSLGVRGVGSSNLPVPTSFSFSQRSFDSATLRSGFRPRAPARHLRRLTHARETAQLGVRGVGSSNL